MNEKTTHAAKGRWKGILLEMGMSPEFLTGKHSPCPFCGGKDRWRFMNTEGSGSWICNNCGSGSGMDLAMKFSGKDFAACAREVDGILGNVRLRPDPRRTRITENERRQILRRLYMDSKPTEPGDVVDTYLRSRGIAFTDYHNLRTAEAISDGEGGIRPAMLALIQEPNGEYWSIHRTFLSRDGRKAEMESPRKMVPVSDAGTPQGVCVRLSGDREVIGIAEGVETALAVEKLFEVPCWAALNAGAMETWVPPEFVREVTVFADNDPGFAGQAAAYRLAQKLVAKGISVNVRIPPEVGTDWNDVLMGEKEAA